MGLACAVSIAPLSALGGGCRARKQGHLKWASHNSHPGSVSFHLSPSEYPFRKRKCSQHEIYRANSHKLTKQEDKFGRTTNPYGNGRQMGAPGRDFNGRALIHARDACCELSRALDRYIGRRALRSPDSVHSRHRAPAE